MLTLKFDVQVASKTLISNWNALFSNRTHLIFLCTTYKRFREKYFISFKERVRERFSTFRFRQHFKRLKFDYSYSDTASNQKIKIKKCFLDDGVFLDDQTNPWESIITKYNEK